MEWPISFRTPNVIGQKVQNEMKFDVELPQCHRPQHSNCTKQPETNEKLTSHPASVSPLAVALHCGHLREFGMSHDPVATPDLTRGIIDGVLGNDSPTPAATTAGLETAAGTASLYFFWAIE